MPNCVPNRQICTFEIAYFIIAALRRQYDFQLEENRRLSQQQNAAAGRILELEQDIQKQQLTIQALSQQQNAAAGRILELEQNIQKQQLTIQAQQLDIEQKIEQITAKDLIIQRKDEQITARNLDIERKGEHITDLQQKVKSSDDGMHFTQIQSSTDNLQSWNIPRTAVQSIAKREIGRGAWGVVYSGTFRGERVAIKQAHRDVLHATTIDMLKREVMIMAHIQHPNLVRFIAAVFDEAVERGTDMPIIVSELMDMNLRVAYKELNLSSFLLSIFCDVAYALHYLHQHRHPIIHRDLSAPNVLLKVLRNGVGYQAKVSDFGSANLAKQAQTAGAGAIVYSAPEMFPNEDITIPPEPQTTKVDVFSYGILLLEVITKEMPTRETRYSMLQQISRRWKLMYELIVHCTKPLPSDRLTMADILYKLNRIPH